MSKRLNFRLDLYADSSHPLNTKLSWLGSNANNIVYADADGSSNDLEDITHDISKDKTCFFVWSPADAKTTFFKDLAKSKKKMAQFRLLLAVMNGDSYEYPRECTLADAQVADVRPGGERWGGEAVKFTCSSVKIELK